MLGRIPVPTRTVAAILAGVTIIGCIERTVTGPSGANAAAFAAHLVAQDGNSQSGPVNSALPIPVTVKVTDATGLAVQGATVAFSVRQGGGSVATPTAVSSASGVASTIWTLGTKVGPQQLVAVLSNTFDSTVFSATATNGPASRILLVSGNGQVGRSAQALPSPLVVEVRDALGNPLSGVSVAFTQGSTNPDGYTSASPVNTGVDGRASVAWTLGKNVTNTTVSMSVTASAVGVPAAAATFTATARPEYRIRRDLTPFLQVDTTGATIGAPGDYLAGVRDTLRVQVYDPTDSSGVQGVVVTWTPQIAGEGIPVNATSVTDNQGFAKTLWVLRSATGGAIPPSNIAKRMIASAAMGQVEFQAKVTPGRICGVSQEGSSGSASVGASVTNVATVRDCNGFPIPGAVVTFSPSIGGSASPSPVTTNAAGQAQTIWTLSTTPGVQTLSATATAKADPYTGSGDLTFGATNVRVLSAAPVAPASVTVVGSPSSSQPHSTPVPITVLVKDANGNVMLGQSVSFAVSAGGGAVLPASATTDSGGTASVVWTLGVAPGVNTLTVTAGSVVLTVTITGT